MCLLLFVTLGVVKDEAKSEITIAVFGKIPTAFKDAATPCRAVEASATEDAVFATAGTLGRGLRRGGVGLHPVLTPFHHVAAHVIETQLVGQQLPHGMAVAMAIAAIPTSFPHLGAHTGIRGVVATDATTGGVLPFGFGGKTEFIACQLAQTCYENLGGVP